MFNQYKPISSQYDKPLLAAAAGALSGIAKALITIAGKKLGLLSVDLVDGSAAILTKNQIHGFGEHFLGWIVVMMVGSLIGLIFYYSLTFLGRDYLIFKAIGAGLTFWLTNTILGIYLGGPLRDYQQFSSHFVFFSSGIVYGITLNWLLKALAFREYNSH